MQLGIKFHDVRVVLPEHRARCSDCATLQDGDFATEPQIRFISALVQIRGRFDCTWRFDKENKRRGRIDYHLTQSGRMICQPIQRSVISLRLPIADSRLAVWTSQHVSKVWSANWKRVLAALPVPLRLVDWFCRDALTG